MRFARAWRSAANGAARRCWRPRRRNPAEAGMDGDVAATGRAVRLPARQRVFLSLIACWARRHCQAGVDGAFYTWGWRIPFLLVR